MGGTRGGPPGGSAAGRRYQAPVETPAYGPSSARYEAPRPAVQSPPPAIRMPDLAGQFRGAASRLFSPSAAPSSRNGYPYDYYAAQQDADSFSAGFGAAAALLANGVVGLSLYNVASTGHGLPSGPYDMLEHLEQISYVIVSAVLGATVLAQAQQGRGLPDGPLGLVGLSQYLSYLSLLAALLVLPLTKLGVVGDPQTALLNVPVLTEAVRAPLEALLAALLATIELVVSAILASIQAMGDHGFSSVADAGADMASTINNIYGKTT